MAEKHQEEVKEIERGPNGVSPPIPGSLEELVKKHLWGPLEEAFLKHVESFKEEDAGETADPADGKDEKEGGMNLLAGDDKEVKGSEGTPFK